MTDPDELTAELSAEFTAELVADIGRLVQVESPSHDVAATGGGAHADHEWVGVDALLPRVNLPAGILSRIRSG